MKLIRFGEAVNERPGVVFQGARIDVSEFVEDYNESFFSGDQIIKLDNWLLSHHHECPVVSDDVRLGPPLARPSKIVCVGLNYAGHARESGMEPPKQPIIFFKATSAIVGPNDDLIIPKNSSKTDWEVELAIVIGQKATNIDESEAYEHIAGYVLHNDYSEREFQLEHGGQWVKGKSADTFAPLGPYVVTRDEVNNPHNLNLWLSVNGNTVQKGNTSDLIFGVPKLVSYISNYMTLLPGDIISTGTPAGVGMGFNPPTYLKHGDKVELGIDGLGSSRQHVKSFM